MAYDDVIRVADLKTRASRFRRVEKEIGVGGRTGAPRHRIHASAHRGGLRHDAGSARRLHHGAAKLVRALDRVVNKGRHFRTDRVHHFLALYFVGGLRRIRRSTLRHRTETAHIEEWLALARDTLAKDYALGVEVLRCRRLIKGYSDTHERGEAKYDRVLSALPILAGRADAAEWLHRLIEAALKDEKGEMLDGALKTIRTL